MKTLKILALTATIGFGGCTSGYYTAGYTTSLYDPFWYWFDYHAYWYCCDDGDDIDWREALEDYWDGLSDAEKNDALDNIQGWVDENRPDLAGVTDPDALVNAISADLAGQAQQRWASLSPSEKQGYLDRIGSGASAGTLPGTVSPGQAVPQPIPARPPATTLPARPPVTTLPARPPVSARPSPLPAVTAPPVAARPSRPPVSRLPSRGGGGRLR